MCKKLHCKRKNQLMENRDMKKQNKRITLVYPLKGVNTALIKIDIAVFL